MMFRRNGLRAALAPALWAGALLAGLAAPPAKAEPSFRIIDRSGLGADAKVYFLGYGTIGKDFAVLGADGKWILAGRTGSGWKEHAWNPTGGTDKKGAKSGAGIVPCHPLTARSAFTIPDGIAGARVYFFQVRKGTRLFDKPCAATVDEKSKDVRGIFGNVIVPGKGGQAPFSYFSTTGGGAMTGATPAQLIAGALPMWTYSEVATGTIDTSQVDFVGFPMNVTARMIRSSKRSVPGPRTGVGFSFSGKGEVNAASVLANYSTFVDRLPVTSKTGSSHVATRQNYRNLIRRTPGGTILVNPGNYLSYFDTAGFANVFDNIIDNHMWKPGWKGRISTGGPFGPPKKTLPEVTFSGETRTLASYNGHKVSGVHAIRFTATVDRKHTVVAYLLSPRSYQALCKAGLIAGCAAMSPAYQVFATAGALNTPIDNNQFGLLTSAEKDVWNNFYGGANTYNAVVTRLGFLVSMAYNHGVAGALQAKGGLCEGRMLGACWNDQALWYPSPKPGSDPGKLYFTGDTTQNEFARWLHTAVIDGVPMMARPSNPVRSQSGIMGMGYGFASDENPTPVNPVWAQTPSKYDSVVSTVPSTGCNYITIMPALATKKANLSPVTDCK